jgi:hypothetical protein
MCAAARCGMVPGWWLVCVCSRQMAAGAGWSAWCFGVHKQSWVGIVPTHAATSAVAAKLAGCRRGWRHGMECVAQLGM